MHMKLDGVDFDEVRTRQEAFGAAAELGATLIELSYYSSIVRADRSEEYRRIGRQWVAVDSRGFIAVVGRGKHAGQFKRDASNKLIILER